MFFRHLNLYYFQTIDNIFPMYNQCKCNKVVKYVFNEIQICCASSEGRDDTFSYKVVTTNMSVCITIIYNIIIKTNMPVQFYYFICFVHIK